MCSKEVSVRPKLSMGLLEAGCLPEDSHSQLGLTSVKDISLGCFLMRMCPDASNLLVWLLLDYRALMALGAAIAKACTWESPSGLKWNFKVGKQTGEPSREAGYTEVILQGLPVTQDKQLLLSSYQTGRCVLSKLLDFKTHMSESHFQFDNFWC